MVDNHLSGGIKILIIDDEEDFAFFTKHNLERIDNYQVITTTEGNDGIQKAKEYRPDLILLDIMMPGINGFEVLRRLKADKGLKSIPVVMLTGKDDEGSRAKAAGLRDDDYIVKPIEIEELRARIKKILLKAENK